MSPSKLIENALSGEYVPDIGQELLKAFGQGFSVIKLRPLLRSTRPEVRGLGSYLAYELGEKCRPLLNDIVRLLDDENSQIRADAINTLSECITKFDEHALGRIISLLDDPDPFVQRQVIRSIQICGTSELNVGIHSAAAMNPKTVFVRFPKLIGGWRPISRRQIEKLWRSENPIARRLAVGMATRPRLVVDDSFLELVEGTDNSEFQMLTQDARKQPRPLNAIGLKLGSGLITRTAQLLRVLWLIETILGIGHSGLRCAASP